MNYISKSEKVKIREFVAKKIVQNDFLAKKRLKSIFAKAQLQ